MINYYIDVIHLSNFKQLINEIVIRDGIAYFYSY